MDFMILDGIQKFHSPLLDTLFVCITRLGDKGFVWCLMALVFLLIPEKRKTGFICVAVLLLTEITGNHILKPLFARVRPCDVNQAVQLLIANQVDIHFPQDIRLLPLRQRLFCVSGRKGKWQYRLFYWQH